MNIGILAIQGDYDAHRTVLERLGATPFFVRMPEHLEQAEGLIIPGGESSTFLKLLGQYSFLDKLRAFVQTRPTFGTCAGAILLAKEVLGPRQSSLGALDIRIRRNAYGRQLESSIREGWLNGRPLEMMFIRAPKIEQVGRGVEILVRGGDDAVLVREDNVMAATFHPELTNDTRVHEMFLELVRNRHAKRGVAVVASTATRDDRFLLCKAWIRTNRFSMQAASARFCFLRCAWATLWFPQGWFITLKQCNR